ncbi:MAG: NAD(P)H-hydrate dehydratase [Phycisphaerales bacterium]|nr:NAD(P)H-hydrate dehydratase [Phycisphaerales bacterium]
MNPQQILTVPKVPQRSQDAHKGDVGRIVVFGGSWGEVGMIGAPSLSANAALKSGAGLVQIITQREAMPMVAPLAPCATTRCLNPEVELSKQAVEFGADVVAIGPGLGQSIQPAAIAALLTEYSGGIVVDADALNALATVGNWAAGWPDNVVLTPHPGEFQRLLDGLGVSECDRDNRIDAAVALAVRTGVTVVLKGHCTVVATREQYYVNQTGNAGMATAGTGDVLTGVIAALMGQGMSAMDAAILGVHAHGLAGDAAAAHHGRISMTALDLLDALAEAFSDLEHEAHR